MATHLCRVLPVCSRAALKGRLRMSLPMISSLNQQMVNDKKLSFRCERKFFFQIVRMSHHDIPEPAGETRTESDTFGPIKVSASAYYGAQTARSMYHFNIGIPTGNKKKFERVHSKSIDCI